jgi:class 3 adenylate cyclase
MPDLDESKIHDYELLVSTELLKEWEQPTDDVGERVQRALAITAEADELLSPDQRVSLAYTIKTLMKRCRNEIGLDFGIDFFDQVNLQIQQIIDSKGESGLGFMELHRVVITKLNEMDELSKTSEDILGSEMIIADIKATVLKLLETMVADNKKMTNTEAELEQKEKELALAIKKGEMDDEFDNLKDNLRGEENFEDILQNMLRLLQEQMNLKGAAVFYREPLKESVAFDDENLPEPDIGQRSTSITEDIDEGDVRIALNATQKDLDDGKEYAPHEMEHDENNETYWVIPIKVTKSERKLGKLVLVTEGGKDDVNDQFAELIKFVESRVDSIVDEGMKNSCKTRLAEECHSISTRTNVSKLPGAYQKYVSLLQRITGLDITFVYDDMIREEDKKGLRFTKQGIHPIDAKSIQKQFITNLGEEGTWGKNGYFVSLFDERGDLIDEIAKDQGEEAGEYEPLCVGTVIVEGDRPITHEQKELLKIVTRILHQDLLERIGEFERLITGAGRGVSERAMDGDLELRGSRPAAVCFLDIVGSTQLCEEVGDKVYSDGLSDWYVDLSDSEIAKIMRSLLDKYTGDGAFMAAGPPYGPDGSDYAHQTVYEEGHYVTNILHNRWRAQESLEKAFRGKVKIPPKLNTGIAYAGEAKVGFLGRRRGKKERRQVGRSEYTIIGDAVHVAARLESEAQNGETLLPVSSYIAHREYVKREKAEGRWDDRVKDHVQIGMPVIAFLKGLSDPVEVVRVISSEEAEQGEQVQKEIFGNKSGLEIAFESAGEIPDGDYIMDGDYVIEDDEGVSDTDDEPPQCKIRIKYDNDTFEAQVSLRDLPEPITKWVSINEYKKILEGEKPSRILRVEDGELFIINYECAEFRQMAAIKEIMEKNKRQKIKTVHYRKMISGDYSVVSYEELEDDCYRFELKRIGIEKNIIAIIPKDRFLTEVADPKILVCSKKKFSCVDEGEPEWINLPVPASA